MPSRHSQVVITQMAYMDPPHQLQQMLLFPEFSIQLYNLEV